MQGPLVSLPPPASPLPRRPQSASFLKRLKRAASRPSSVPKPTPPSTGLAAQHLVSSALAAARHVAKDDRQANASDVMVASAAQDSHAPAHHSWAAVYEETRAVEDEQTKQLREWEREACFELSIISRIGPTY